MAYVFHNGNLYENPARPVIIKDCTLITCNQPTIRKNKMKKAIKDIAACIIAAFLIIFYICVALLPIALMILIVFALVKYLGS